MAASSGISRRHFLGMAAAAGVLPAWSARASHAEIRVGLIGHGARGAVVCEALDAMPGARIAATGNRNWRALLDRADIDAVVIATPDYLHAPMTIAALESGKHVYCERPMALTAEDATRVRDASRASGLACQIGTVEASSPQWRAANEIIRAGTLGSIIWSQSATDPAPTRASLASLSTETHWRHTWACSNGIVSETFDPRLAGLLSALGEGLPDRVAAAGGVYSKAGRETPDSFVLTAYYPSGHKIALVTSIGTHANHTIIRGERAAIEFEEGAIRVNHDDGREERMPVSGATLEMHLQNWLDAIHGKNDCTYSPEHAYAPAVIQAAAIEAYRQNRTQRIQPSTHAFAPVQPAA